MEAGDREAIRRFWLRGLAQKVDCRKDVRLDQSQSPPGSRLRALRYHRRRLRPPRHDPHHAQAACCKRLVMNPNFPDGLLDNYLGRSNVGVYATEFYSIENFFC